WIRLAGLVAGKNAPRLLIAPCQVSSIARGSSRAAVGHPITPVELLRPARRSQASLSPVDRSVAPVQSVSVEKFMLPEAPSVTMNSSTWRHVAGSLFGLKYTSSLRFEVPATIVVVGTTPVLRSFT